LPPSDFGTPQDFTLPFAQEAETLGIVSQHAYTGGSTAYGDDPYPGSLLEPSSSVEDAEAAEPYIAVSHAWDLPYRMAEMNSIMCSGEPGVSDAFEAALWTIDTPFEYAARGVAGVNLHSNVWNTIHGWEVYGVFLFDVPESQYRASDTEAAPPEGARFTEGYELRAVLPLCYGMLFFAEATANTARLLPVNMATEANLKAWAVFDPTSGAVRVAIINKDLEASGTVALAVPGYFSGTLKRLAAPAFRATEGISFGGQSFDGSRDGIPGGAEASKPMAARNGAFTIPVAPTSAVLATLRP
jgi:Glycosyl hydrolase family 79 C-terminal beta domain